MKHSKLVLAVSLAVGSSPIAVAKDITVNDLALGTNSDPTVITLRDAIQDANNSAGIDTIIFDNSLNGSSIQQATTTISEDLIIDGGNNITIINATEAGIDMYQLKSDADVALTLKNLTLTTSTAAPQSFVISSSNSNSHKLTLDNVTARHDASTPTATQSAFNTGSANVEIKNSHFAGIVSNSFGSVLHTEAQKDLTINIDNSVFDANQNTSSVAGALGLATASGTGVTITATINNSSFSRNTAAANGGAIAATAASTDRINLIINNTTIAGNTGTSNGGGIYASTESSTVDIRLNNSIVADNISSGASADIFTGSGASVTATNSLIEDNADVAFLTADSSNILGIDPKLNAIAQNGSQIGFNYMPMADSPVINKGTSSATLPSTDLTGNARVSGCSVDMGAIEFQKTGPALKTGATTSYSIAAVDTDLTIQLSDLYSETGLTFKAESINGTSSLPTSFNINSTDQLIVSVTAEEINTKLPLTVKLTASNATTCLDSTQLITINKETTSSTTSSSTSSSAISPWLALLFSLPLIARLRRK